MGLYINHIWVCFSNSYIKKPLRLWLEVKKEHIQKSPDISDYSVVQLTLPLSYYVPVHPSFEVYWFAENSVQNPSESLIRG